MGRIFYIITSIIGMVGPILVTLGLIVFLWGMIKYMTAGADSEGRTEARNVMIYGVIGMFVMVSVFGLVGVLQRSFWVSGGGTWVIPKYPSNL
jgi:hypothetical protein